MNDAISFIEPSQLMLWQTDREIVTCYPQAIKVLKRLDVILQAPSFANDITAFVSGLQLALLTG